MEGSFYRYGTVMKYLQVFVDESTLDKHVRVLKIQDAAANATVDYINKMGQEGTADEYIVGTELKKVEDSSSFNPCWRIRE